MMKRKETAPIGSVGEIFVRHRTIDEYRLEKRNEIRSRVSIEYTISSGIRGREDEV
jgi:hypothetical protein